MREILGGYAHSTVLHLDEYAFSGGDRPRRQIGALEGLVFVSCDPQPGRREVDPVARRRALDGVVHHVRHDLLDSIRVREKKRKAQQDIDTLDKSRPLCLGAQPLDGRDYHLGDAHPLQPNRRPTRFYGRELQQLLDHMSQSICLHIHTVQEQASS